MSKTPTNHGKLCPTLHRWVVIDDEIDDENDEIIDDEIDDQYCFWISRILPRILSSVLHSQLENCAILELKQLWFTIAMPSQISRPYARRLENYIEPASFLFNHHISSYIDEPWRPWRHHFADLKFESISPKAERLKNGSQGSRKVEHLAEKMLVSTAHIGLSENVVYRIPQNGSFYRENYDKHDKP